MVIVDSFNALQRFGYDFVAGKDLSTFLYKPNINNCDEFPLGNSEAINYTRCCAFVNFFPINFEALLFLFLTFP